MDVQIEESWKKVLNEEFQKDYFAEMVRFLKTEKEAGKIIYPAGSQMFNAFSHTPFEAVKVVILGQDPYHNPGQAHGLSFSVPAGIRKPPSLQNILKELRSDTGLAVPESGNLEPWAKQGVLLLNASLSVRQNEPASHSRIGWLSFSDAVIQKVSALREGVIFLLWGGFAKQKRSLIDEQKHHILEAAHPSPLSAHSGFFGCKHFSKTNELLASMGKEPIDWKI